MADLSTLDAAAPLGTDAVSGGDDAIRATRDAVKTSFGGTDSGSGTQTSEHYLKGFHKFPMGASATKPTAGNAGRLFIDTEKMRVERDTGAAWAMLNTAQVYQLEGDAVTNITSSWKVMASQVIQVATGARVIVYGMALLIPSAAGAISMRLTFNSSTVLEPAISGIAAVIDVPVTGSTMSCMGYNAPAAGSYTVTVEVKTEAPFTAYGTAGMIVLVV